MPRRTWGFVLLGAWMSALVGCFSLGNIKSGAVVDVGPPSGEKDRTLDYWNQVRGAMREKSTATELRQVANVVRRQAETIRSLPIDGVDYDLYVSANAVAQSQEKMLTLAEKANYDLAVLRSDAELRKSYPEAGQHTSAAINKLKNLRATLSTRYGAEFLPLED